MQICHLVIPVVLPQPLVGPVRGLEGDVAVEELVLPHLHHIVEGGPTGFYTEITCVRACTDFEAAAAPEVVVVHVAPHDVDGAVALPADEHAGVGHALEGHVRPVSPQAGHHLKCRRGSVFQFHHDIYFDDKRYRAQIWNWLKY